MTTHTTPFPQHAPVGEVPLAEVHQRASQALVRGLDMLEVARTILASNAGVMADETASAAAGTLYEAQQRLASLHELLHTLEIMTRPTGELVEYRWFPAGIAQDDAGNSGPSLSGGICAETLAQALEFAGDQADQPHVLVRMEWSPPAQGGAA